MRRPRFALLVLAALILVAGCTGPSTHPLPPRTTPTTSATAQDLDGTERKWPLQQATAVQPMRMDKVMAAVDERLEKSGRARFAGRYRHASHQVAVDRSEAPYFHVPGQGDGTESLPLESTSARVSIAGVIAQVLVTQVYRNRGDKPIEAVYVFPGSTRAAVHGMRMTIGKRVIVARIKQRDEARADYEAAKETGKRASLLEQQRPNVFTMNVANIMPGDVIKTELAYSELLVPDEGTYNFVYPTVVGPRNPMGADPATSRWVANPYLKQGEKPPYRFGIKLHLSSPIGLKQVSSPSHRVRVAYASRKDANVTLDETGGDNRDFVLRYRLSGDRIESGAMLYDHGGEKFFLMMMEPPARVQQKQIPPREYVFVLDVSGSMHGFPLKTAKALMSDLLGKMRPHDYFNVVVFAGRAGVLNPRSLPATPANVEQALGTIEQMRGGGGTNLMDALRTSYALPQPEQRAMSRSVVVVTDGYVAVEAKAFRFIRKRLGETNLFAFGIGSSVNRALIEGMARAGMGSPFVVLDRSSAATQAAKLRRYIEAPVLTDIKVAFKGLEVYDSAPSALPDLMAHRPLILFGKYRGHGKGSIEVVGSRGDGTFRQTMTLDPAAASPNNRALRSLWARKWAEQLMDQFAALGGDEQIEKAVTNLGLGYNLLTQFTSFVAVDSRVVNQSGRVATVKQPLPLPQGVSNYAVAGHARTTRARAYAPANKRMQRSYAPRGHAGGAAPSAAEAAAPPPAPEPMTAADKSASPAGASVAGGSVSSAGPRIAALHNIKRGRRAWLRRMLRVALQQCVAAGRRGRLTILIMPDGQVRIGGATGGLAACSERRHLTKRLAAAHPTRLLQDRSRPGRIEVVLR